MQVGEVDVHDDDQLCAFWEAAKEADGYQRPYAAYWSLNAATVAMRDPNNPFEQHPMVATHDGEVVGTSQVTLPRLDNTHVALLGVGVRPAHRRRGVGTVLLDRALEVIREHGRTTVMSEVDLPMHDVVPVGGYFLERRGFSRASTEIHRVLDLPVDGDLLAKLEDEAATYHGDYRIETFGDRIPDEHVKGFCILQEAFNSEAPIGDLDLEPEVWDESRVRNNEERYAKQGRRRLCAIALARNGEVVALTELTTADANAWQSATLVVSGHRGHRLGLAVKLANLRRFQSEFPSIAMIHSWNAEVNGPMVAINDRLGFRPVELLVEMQRLL